MCTTVLSNILTQYFTWLYLPACVVVKVTDARHATFSVFHHLFLDKSTNRTCQNYFSSIILRRWFKCMTFIVKLPTTIWQVIAAWLPSTVTRGFSRRSLVAWKSDFRKTKNVNAKKNLVHLPPLGNEEDPVPLHRGVWSVGELKVVLANLGGY